MASGSKKRQEKTKKLLTKVRKHKEKIAKPSVAKKLNIGRPSDAEKVELDKLYNLCLLGLNNTELAAYYGIDESTLTRWRDSWDGFRTTMQAGREDADGLVTRKLFQRANGYSHPEEVIKVVRGKVKRLKTIKHYPPDTNAATYWLNNRQKLRWKNKQEGEDTPPPPSGPVVVQIITDEATKEKLFNSDKQNENTAEE